MYSVYGIIKYGGRIQKTSHALILAQAKSMIGWKGGGLSSMYMWYILYYLEGRPLINMLYRRRFAANMDFLVSWKMGIKCSNLVCGKGGKFTFWVILVFTWKGGKLLKISLEKGSFQFSERWWNTFFHDSASTRGNVNSLWM